MNDLSTRRKANEDKRRLLSLKSSAYEHKLKKDIDPDSPEWMETYTKLRALDNEMDEAFLEMISIKHELATASR